MTENIKSNFEDKTLTIKIVMYLTKPVNIICHVTLFDKIDSYEIRGVSPTLIVSS